MKCPPPQSTVLSLLLFSTIQGLSTGDFIHPHSVSFLLHMSQWPKLFYFQVVISAQSFILVYTAVYETFSINGSWHFKCIIYRGAWVALLVKHLTLAWVMISQFVTWTWVQAPCRALWWQHRACSGFSVSLSFRPSPACSHSLSKINKTFKLIIYKIEHLMFPQNSFWPKIL